MPDRRTPVRSGGLAVVGALALSAWATTACSADASDAMPPADGSPAPVAALPYASSIVAFEPGADAGFGQDKLPDVVLGPPTGKGTGAGSLDVLSLGKGGGIVLGFEPFAIVDGEGPDFVVFENPFWPGGDSAAVYAEPGTVSVSEDGDDWRAFPCAAAGDGAGHFPGCAGVTPTEAYAANALVPLDASLTGGDAFDLADVGLTRARFVRIDDACGMGQAPSAGFDLDAAGIVNADPPARAPE